MLNQKKSSKDKTKGDTKDLTINTNKKNEKADSHSNSLWQSFAVLQGGFCALFAVVFLVLSLIVAMMVLILFLIDLILFLQVGLAKGFLQFITPIWKKYYKSLSFACGQAKPTNSDKTDSESSSHN